MLQKMALHALGTDRFRLEGHIALRLAGLEDPPRVGNDELRWDLGQKLHRRLTDVGFDRNAVHCCEDGIDHAKPQLAIEQRESQWRGRVETLELGANDVDGSPLRGITILTELGVGSHREDGRVPQRHRQGMPLLE